MNVRGRHLLASCYFLKQDSGMPSNGIIFCLRIPEGQAGSKHRLTCLPINLFIHPPEYHPPTHPSIHAPFTYPSTCLSIHLITIHPSVHSSNHPSIPSSSIYLSIFLSILRQLLRTYSSFNQREKSLYSDSNIVKRSVKAGT